ncbi:MAG: hypothetical protein GY842_14130 [bacterium]|nr:hypothetical protein [bacterium]
MNIRLGQLRVALSVLLLLALAPLAQPARGEVLRIPQLNETTSSNQAQLLVAGPWGSAPGQFGKVDEASRPGPMDFAVNEDSLFVLDPVNSRVQVFSLEGTFLREIPIGTRTADFLGIDDTGAVVVLDPFVRREYKVYSPAGELRTHAAMPSAITLASAVFLEGERVWIEERHHQVHEVLAGSQVPRAPAQVVGTLEGRPQGADRSVVHVRREGADQIVIRRGPPGQAEDRRTLRFPQPVASIAALETDAAGRVYVAANCPCEPEKDPWTTDLVVIVLTPAGELVGTLRLPNRYVTDHYRKLCVSRDGHIIQMQTTEEEVRFVRWTVAIHTGKGGSR